MRVEKTALVGPPLDVVVREFDIADKKLLQSPIDVDGVPKEFHTAPLGIHTMKNANKFFVNQENWIESMLPVFIDDLPEGKGELYKRAVKAAWEYAQKEGNPNVCAILHTRPGCYFSLFF